MSVTTNIDQLKLIANEFADSLKKDNILPIEQLIKRVSPDNWPVILLELIIEEYSYRWKRGDLPTIAEYKKRFPEHEQLVDKACCTRPTDGGVQYTLIEKLGEGKFGQVYLANDNDLGRKVAVKVLHEPIHNDASKQACFERELQIAANLDHPNIVQIYETRTFNNGRRYAVMKYISDINLDMHLKAGSISPVDAVRLLLPVVNAVQYAHSQQLVAHRDLKPANILLDLNNIPHVADFGLAITFQDELEGNYLVGGTVAYMAPEQFHKDEDLSGCDVWALGVILYEMITGERPFKGGNVQRLREKIETIHPICPSSLCKDIDNKLDNICMRCLEKVPEQRYRVDELKEELEKWLAAHNRVYACIMSKKFNIMLKNFPKEFRKEKAQIIEAAKREAALSGKIRKLNRLLINDLRLPGLEFYDLENDYRLVVQLMDTYESTRFFLCCGTQTDVDEWLENHKDHVWVRSGEDDKLDLIPPPNRKTELVPPVSANLSSPEPILQLALLRDFNQKDWNLLSLPERVEKYMREVTSMRLEEDQASLFRFLENNCESENQAAAARDVLILAHKGDISAVRNRINLFVNKAAIVEGKEVSIAMTKPINNEQFVSWEETADLHEALNGEWEEWMIFLHPNQKDLSRKEFHGPARLKGVSGSGKTIVLLHRARYLARKYQQPVLLVTLTRSTQNLLEQLLNKLCGPEKGLIIVQTMSSLARALFYQQSLSDSYNLVYTKQDRSYSDVQRAINAAAIFLQSDIAFQKQKMTPGRILDFFREEQAYVRSRLRKEEYELYLSPSAFPRRGRGYKLDREPRRSCLQAIRIYENELKNAKVKDPESIVQDALSTVLENPPTTAHFRWRNILVDEVQDLSQLEMTLLANLRTSDDKRITDATDGLFLVGDGAQTIYRRGFTLARSGITVYGRTITFRKNYRNTKEILTAAYGLIERYEFADIDEENIAKPICPEYATRQGERPTIIKCASFDREMDFVAKRIQHILDKSEQDGNECQICVIGANGYLRDQIESRLGNLNIAHSNLRTGTMLSSENVVKIDTIESAKGHEFTHVFIPGLCEGVLPQAVPDEEISREAARLYVAMTRARDCLYLSYSIDSREPSRFLRAIQSGCDVEEYLGFGQYKPLDD